MTTWWVYQDAFLLQIMITRILFAHRNFYSFQQIKLPFEKLIHALRNFPDDAMNPDTLLPMAYSIKVFLLHNFFFMNDDGWDANVVIFSSFMCMYVFWLISRYPGVWRKQGRSMRRRMERTISLQRMRNSCNEGSAHLMGAMLILINLSFFSFRTSRQ